MNPEEKSLQEIVNQFYSLISRKDLTEILIESFTSSIQSEVDQFNLTSKEISDKVFIHHSVIKFFNDIYEMKGVKAIQKENLLQK